MNDSLEAEAQALLLAAYGGQLSHDEMGFTVAQVMFWLMQERDGLIGELLRAKKDLFIPDNSWFTSYDEVAVTWNSAREYAEIALPSIPVQLPHDRGLRIEPATGGGAMFIRTAYNYVNMNPRYAWLEGNWSWEIRPMKAIFTNMRYADMPRFVSIQIFNTKVVEAGKPFAVPSEFRAECRNRVLNLMGLGRQDTQTDGIDQRSAERGRR